MKEELARSLEDHDSPRKKPVNGNGSSNLEAGRLCAGAGALSASHGQPAFEPVLDSEEAAALLHIHPKTLQRLARNGQIPGFRIGKLWGFRASVLNQWLEGRMAGCALGPRLTRGSSIPCAQPSVPPNRKEMKC